jgi:hypothetical protein
MALAYDGLLPQVAAIAPTWTSSSITAAVVPEAVGSEAPRGRRGQADRRRGDARRRRLVVLQRNELSRLYRDVLAGMFHPSDPESAHATVAAAWLGPVSS